MSVTRMLTVLVKMVKALLARLESICDPWIDRKPVTIGQDDIEEILYIVLDRRCPGDQVLHLLGDHRHDDHGKRRQHKHDDDEHGKNARQSPHPPPLQQTLYWVR